MTLILDWSAISVSNLMMQEGVHTHGVNEDMLRHMVLNSLRALNMKFKDKFGPELVTACDASTYWRRDFFPHYKAGRKTMRENSSIDWDVVHATFKKIRQELKDYFPYKTIEVDGAEADDVIAVLVKKWATEEPQDMPGAGGLGFGDNCKPILIVSGDQDFYQLHDLPGVKQYSNIKKEFLEVDNVGLFLKEKCIRGEAKAKDGIPNILSRDDIFLSDERQPPINKQRLEKYMDMSVSELYESTHYKRNRTLIDFDFIPQDVRERILKEYETATPKPRNRLLNYFITHNLSSLTKSIGDF